MAVFKHVPHDKKERRLVPKTFDSGQLRRYEISLARASYTSREAFDSKVVGSKTNDVVGVACAEAKDLQSIPYILDTAQPKIKGRAVCLIDKVACEDHDGHAALGWSESQRVLTDKQKERAGEVVKSNLVAAFGTIMNVGDVGWVAPSPEQRTSGELSPPLLHTPESTEEPPCLGSS